MMGSFVMSLVRMSTLCNPPTSSPVMLVQAECGRPGFFAAMLLHMQPGTVPQEVGAMLKPKPAFDREFSSVGDSDETLLIYPKASPLLHILTCQAVRSYEAWPLELVSS